MKIDIQKTTSGFNVIGINEELCPVSLELDLQTKNLINSAGKNKLFVIPAKTKNYKVTSLKIKNKQKGISYRLKSSAIMGDVTDSKFDKDYKYTLPFAKSKSYKITQGYNGKHTHQKVNALDFGMEKGTAIHAVRGGTVIEVIEKHSKGCLKEKCKKYDNHILIMHSDGTFATYGHIKKKGAIVKIGDKVKDGQHIGYSGNVGYSSGPHLHLEIFMPRFGKNLSLKTKFMIGNGKTTEFLQEGKNYLRLY